MRLVETRSLSVDFHTHNQRCNAAAAAGGTKRAKIVEKVHKHPLGVNVINFESNRFNGFI